MYILTIGDKFTRWVYPLPDRSAIGVANALMDFFSRFGFPMRLLSDKGKEFLVEVVALPLRTESACVDQPPTQLHALQPFPRCASITRAGGTLVVIGANGLEGISTTMTDADIASHGCNSRIGHCLLCRASITSCSVSQLRRNGCQGNGSQILRDGEVLELHACTSSSKVSNARSPSSHGISQRQQKRSVRQSP